MLVLLVLLVIWFAVSFGAGTLFVEQLNNFQFFGFPLGFWFAQQGSIPIFVLMIYKEGAIAGMAVGLVSTFSSS